MSYPLQNSSPGSNADKPSGNSSEPPASSLYGYPSPSSQPPGLQPIGYGPPSYPPGYAGAPTDYANPNQPPQSYGYPQTGPSYVPPPPSVPVEGVPVLQQPQGPWELAYGVSEQPADSSYFHDTSKEGRSNVVNAFEASADAAGMNGMEACLFWTTSIFNILAIILLMLAIFLSGVVWGPFAIMYLFYLGFSVASPVNSYLSDVGANGTLESGNTIMANVTPATPVVSIEITCYHTTGGKHKHTVVTYQEKKYIAYKTWYNSSSPLSFQKPPGNTAFVMYRLRMNKEVEAADAETKAVMDAIYKDLEDRNRNRDVCYRMNKTLEISGWADSHFVTSDGDEHLEVSYCMRGKMWFWIWTLLLLGIPYRVWFFSKTAGVDFTLEKLISIHPPAAQMPSAFGQPMGAFPMFPSPWQQPPGQSIY